MNYKNIPLVKSSLTFVPSTQEISDLYFNVITNYWQYSIDQTNKISFYPMEELFGFVRVKDNLENIVIKYSSLWLQAVCLHCNYSVHGVRCRTRKDLLYYYANYKKKGHLVPLGRCQGCLNIKRKKLMESYSSLPKFTNVDETIFKLEGYIIDLMEAELIAFDKEIIQNHLPLVFLNILNHFDITLEQLTIIIKMKSTETVPIDVINSAFDVVFITDDYLGNVIATGNPSKEDKALKKKCEKFLKWHSKSKE